MNGQCSPFSVQDLTKGLEITELEERLEMVHLSAVEAEATVRCDTGHICGVEVDVEIQSN